MAYPKVIELNINAEAAPAMVQAWMVKGEIQGSSYDHFLVALFHLRPIKGVGANKAKAAMTHEIFVAPLVATVPDRQIKENETFPMQGITIAKPVDMNIQFRAQNDARAAFFVSPLVEMIKTGAVGVTRQWQKHWIQCLAQGTHYDVFTSVGH